MMCKRSTAARAAAAVALLLAASALLAPAYARKDIQAKTSIPRRQLGEMAGGGLNRAGNHMHAHGPHAGAMIRANHAGYGYRYLAPAALMPSAWFGNPFYGGAPVSTGNWYYSHIAGQPRTNNYWLTNTDVDNARYETMSWRDWPNRA